MPTSSHVPVVPVVAGAVVAQFTDDVVRLLLPLPGLGALSGLIAILLTAVAARTAARGRLGPVAARTGLAVGVTSAVLGLLVGGLGLVAILLAGITVVAGVVGATRTSPRGV